MTLLHVYFSLRNQQAFQRLLDRDRHPQAGPASTSASKSWTRKTIASALEVNAFDHLGRTVLHLACASTEPACLEYVRMLLAHPSINVNLPDKENHWTALHRALYAANIEAAIMLLKRTDVDTSVKDLEGHTAFDLFNSTISTASPTSSRGGHANLLTWGANRNAALGLGDSNDRTHPDHVVFKDAPLPVTRSLDERFQPIRVRDVSMSKLHTVILTDEPCDNVRLCGFGSGGRLGAFSHTLYTPTPIAFPSHHIVFVALGQDHTLALTSAGEVMSWGLNRFSQLGYTVEAGQGGSVDESIQTTPRKINHLKKEFIKGVAACKTASACWSVGDVWTWGTNNGQLGYSKMTSPVQVLPRKASIITQPIRGIVMSDTAMVCLFTTGEVVCVWNGGVSKINFPAHAFPSDIATIYRPPQAVRAPAIAKLVCCDDTFAALSSNGEVFTFSLPTATEVDGTAGGSRGLMKPQRAWALRRQSSSVRDVDIGGDGALIVCTQSGHVFVRSRNLKGSTMNYGTKAFKFQRVAHVQRAVAVCANSTGAFGALRVDYNPTLISVTGRSFSADVAAIAPFVDEPTGSACRDTKPLDPIVGTDDDVEDESIMGDIGEVAKLMAVLHGRANRHQAASVMGSKHGADVIVQVDTEFEVPAHRVVLAARCMPLREVLAGERVLGDTSSKISVTCTSQPLDAPLVSPVLHFKGITPLALLILLHYLYADEVLAVWDRRIGLPFEQQFSSLGVLPAKVKADLATLARLLCLPHLASALQFVGKCVAKPSAHGDFQWLFEQAQLVGTSRRNVRIDPLAPDVALHFADKTVYTYSVVLRARSAFFSAFFSDPDWTAQRRDGTGVVDVEMGHHKWQIMRFVLSFVCFGEEAMFETLEFLDNVDELLEFIFLVISAANELLLTRLVLLCSGIVLKHLNVYNACYLLTDAIHFNAVDLADRIQSYMAANLEMLLESRILDDLDLRVVRQLSEHTSTAQAAESPVSRSGKLGRAALEKHKAWLVLQDIPVPIVPSVKPWSVRDSARISPPSPAKKTTGQRWRHSPTTSPVFGPSLAPPPPSGDEIFAMDDADGALTLKLNLAQASGGEEMPGGPGRVGWKKNLTTPRTDLKAIMAEAECGEKQVHGKTLDGQNSSPGVNVMSGMGGVTSGNADTRAAGQGLTPSRQLGPIRWQSETPSTPRRVLSNPATPSRTEASTPTRTSAVARATQVTPGSPGPSRASVGPIITPVRQTPVAPGIANTSSSGSRKPSLGGAWTLPPVQPIAAPTVPSSTTLSFAEIQRMQEMQGSSSSSSKDKRSLRDIQEEEMARQQEADFMKWWVAEEERVRLAMLEEERERVVGHHSKNKGGKAARHRKAKLDTQPEGTPSNAMQQRESRGNRQRDVNS